MNKDLGNIPLVMPLVGNPPYSWILDDYLLQATIKRFAENINFRLLVPRSFSSQLLGQYLLRQIPSLKDRVLVGAADWRSGLFEMMGRAKTTQVMVIPESAFGMPLAAINLIGDLLQSSETHGIYSNQIVGLLPWLLSKKFLQHTVKDQSQSSQRVIPLPPLKRLPLFHLDRLLLSGLPKRHRASGCGQLCTSLLEICSGTDQMQNIRFVQPQIAPEPIFYLPRNEQDRALAHYLMQKVPSLDRILRSVGQLPAPDSSAFTAHFREFCDAFAVTNPIYHLTGEPDIPEEIRGLTSNPKSVGDCYLRAIHFTKFLKTYTGLHSTSRVLDVGCGWGVLALGLANLIEEPGSYIGLDIQEKAIIWAKKNIAPLNPRFSFLHLDIANTRYNPQGAIPYDRVQLPIESESIDLVVLSSVFTHMRREAIEGYLREFRRILSPGGIAAFSYFHSSFFGLNEDYKVQFPDNPDRMTLFSTKGMQKMLAENGLVQACPQVNYSGRFNVTEPFFQTFMFATKRSLDHEISSKIEFRN